MFYIAVVAFAIGVGIASIIPVSLPFIIWLLVIALAIALMLKRHDRGLYRPFLSAVTIALVFASFGTLRMEWYSADILQPSSFTNQVNEDILFSGVVSAEPDERARTTQLQVDSGGQTVLVSIDRHHEVSYGDEVLVAGTLKRPEAFETEYGRTFDYPGYLLARGITYQVSFADISVISEGNGNPIIAVLLEIKQWLMTGIESVLTEPEAGLAEGLLLGVKQALGDTVEEAFRKSGIIHIVVLSGYNVMLVVAFIMYILAPFPRKVQLGVGLLAITSFALIVGLSATVLRATIMAGLFLIAQTFSKRYNVLRMLCLAGAVMLFINPYLLLYDIGFQLSFMATLGLILVSPHFETELTRGSLPKVREYVLATVATQIAVLPLLLYHIGEVSLIAVVVNVLVLPIVPVAMFGGFVSGLLGQVWPIVGLLAAYPTSLILTYIIGIAAWFSNLPYATLIAPPFSPLLIPFLYGVIVFGLWFFFYRVTSADNDLQDWTIVDEGELLVDPPPGMAASSTARKQGKTDEIPIFFR
jgi:competence protein ComEC